MRWEYVTVVVHYDEASKDEDPWQILNQENRPRANSMDAIMNILGEQGWEIITVTIEHSVITKVDITPDTYMIFCKKPKTKN